MMPRAGPFFPSILCGEIEGIFTLRREYIMSYMQKRLSMSLSAFCEARRLLPSYGTKGERRARVANLQRT